MVGIPALTSSVLSLDDGYLGSIDVFLARRALASVRRRSWLCRIPFALSCRFPPMGTTQVGRHLLAGFVLFDLLQPIGIDLVDRIVRDIAVDVSRDVEGPAGEVRL